MKDRIWEADYRGRTLRVVNRWALRPPRMNETLEVEGREVAARRGGFVRLRATLRAAVGLEGTTRRDEARIAQRAGSPRTGCHVLADGELVGGEVGNRLQYPVPEIARSQVETGEGDGSIP